MEAEGTKGVVGFVQVWDWVVLVGSESGNKEGKGEKKGVENQIITSIPRRGRKKRQQVTLTHLTPSFLVPP